MQTVQQQSEIQVENSSTGNSSRPSLRKRFMGRFRKLSEDQDDLEDSSQEATVEPKMMSEAELLHKYWKLVVSLPILKVSVLKKNEGHDSNLERGNHNMLSITIF